MASFEEHCQDCLRELGEPFVKTYKNLTDSQKSPYGMVCSLGSIRQMQTQRLVTGTVRSGEKPIQDVP